MYTQFHSFSNKWNIGIFFFFFKNLIYFFSLNLFKKNIFKTNEKEKEA